MEMLLEDRTPVQDTLAVFHQNPEGSKKKNKETKQPTTKWED